MGAITPREVIMAMGARPAGVGIGIITQTGGMKAGETTAGLIVQAARPDGVEAVADNPEEVV